MGEDGSAYLSSRGTGIPATLRSGALAAVTIVLVLVALALVFEFLVWSDALAATVPALSRHGAPTGLFVVLAAGLIGLALLIGAIAFGETMLAVLVVTSAVLPSLAGAGVILIYLATGPSQPLHADALYIGAAAAVAVWALSAPLLRWLAKVDTAQSRSFGELEFRTRRLKARLGAAPQDAATPAVASLPAEAATYLMTLESQLGLTGPLGAGFRFAFATGYVNLWRCLHRAEEALIGIQPPADTAAEAASDYLRLRGLPNSKELGMLLQRALAQLGPVAAPARDPAIVIAPEPHRAAAATGLSILAAVRLAINTYRDDAWEGLIRERNRLLRTVAVTSFVTLLLVALAVLSSVDKAALLAASAFYLVGSVVGLFARLRAEGRASSALDDYGLFEARLIATPLLSGLAALGGAFVVALAPAVLGTDATAAQASSNLAQVFSLADNTRGLVAAAVFGLAPELLVAWLGSRANTIQGQLANTNAAGDPGANSTPAGDANATAPQT